MTAHKTAFESMISDTVFESKPILKVSTEVQFVINNFMIYIFSYYQYIYER